MEWRATAVTAVLPMSALPLTGLATDIPAGIATFTATGLISLIQAFMCVRGRVWAAWLSYALSVAVIVALNALMPPQDGMMNGIAPNMAVLLMATFFATIVRPRARQIYTLRHRTEGQITAAAAQEAAAAVRAQQLAYLDLRARPLLDRIASGVRLDDDVARECSLVEAQLRDRIRAPGLDSPAVVAAVWEARGRGVKVLLLDDRDPGERGNGRQEWLDHVRDAAVAALGEARSSGAVTVRLLPRGRDTLATVTVVEGDRVRRAEFGPDGRGLSARR